MLMFTIPITKIIREEEASLTWKQDEKVLFQFTVFQLSLVPWPLNEYEAGVDHVSIVTSLLVLC